MDKKLKAGMIGGGPGAFIGSHAANLAEYVSGLKITSICADLTKFVTGRVLDDDANCLLRFENGAKGILNASQISVGEENNHAIWVYGDQKSVEWHQENPNYLKVKPLNRPIEMWQRGNDYVNRISPAAAKATRLPCGHPEGFIEAFADIYSNLADTIYAVKSGKKPDKLSLDFPNVDDGVRGMRFIKTVVDNSNSDKKWAEIAD